MSYTQILRTQWSLDSKSINFERKTLSFNFQYTGGYLCCSQWSVIRYAEFFSEYLFLYLDKSLLYSNLRTQWSLDSKSINFERKTLSFNFQYTGGYLCSSQWSVIRHAEFFSHYSFLCLDKSVLYSNLRTQWSLDSKSINFGRKTLSFNFQYTGGYLCSSQWSVIRYAEFFSDYLFLCLDKSVLYSNLRTQWSLDSKSINFERKTLSLNFQYTGGYLCCSQWSVIRHAEFFSDYLFLCLDKSVLYSNLRTQWSLDSKSINFGRKTLSFNFQYTGGYLCCSQWSVIRHAEFFSDYLFLCLDKSLLYSNLRTQWSLDSKSINFERKTLSFNFQYTGGYLCCSQWSVIRHAEFFSHYSFLCLDKSVWYSNLRTQWSLDSQSINFERKTLSFNFQYTGGYLCCSQWSVIRYAEFFSEYLFLYLDKSLLYSNLRTQWSLDSKSINFERKTLSFNFQYTGGYLCCSQWSVIRHAEFFSDYLFLCLDKSVLYSNLRTQWSLDSKSINFERKTLSFNFQYTGGYLCCSQWSVIRYAEFFSEYLFLYLDKSLLYSNLRTQWSLDSKSINFERKTLSFNFQYTGGYLCCSQWSVIRHAEFFSHYSFLCLDKSVLYSNLRTQWSLDSKSINFGRKTLSFNFQYTGGYLCSSQWSVIRHAEFFSDYLFLCLDKSVLYSNLRTQWSLDSKSINFERKTLSFNFQYTGGYLCCSQWSVIRHAEFFSDYLFLCLDKSVSYSNLRTQWSLDS